MSMIYHVLDVSLIMAMAAPGMSSFSIESMVRGHHIYKDRWCPVTGILFRENLFRGNKIFTENFGTRNKIF